MGLFPLLYIHLIRSVRNLKYSKVTNDHLGQLGFVSDSTIYRGEHQRPLKVQRTLEYQNYKIWRKLQVEFHCFWNHFNFFPGEEAGSDAAEGSGDAAEAAADGSGDANGSGMDLFIYGRNCYIWPAYMKPKFGHKWYI